ncbi:probable UGA4 GABA permease-also involved in delta-aminolevulinate transport [Rhynchosporium secalis]|uniref:Probable UGA4 GABA permease-also involved in delta-aminolevulinate transport n=1 Tax=Rhynchosporium secalis TaxID=38038 RepID=A0A1E1LX30_RHYSE|nr:probable UGA4 GABA permease-also involved in delta-aminolevulinate transport [Rhynchosporium secalis]
MASGRGYKDGSNEGSITHDEKVNKAHAISGMEEGSTASISADDQLLAKLGYRAELKREFSYLTVFGQSFGAMGIAPAIAESIVFSLGSGGSVGMVWTYLAGCLLLIPVAASLGELGSAMPTSGGIYYWVARLTPPRQRAFVCWLAGYMNVLGYISIYASTIYAATLLLGATIAIGRDETWFTSKYHNYGMFAAMTLLTFGMTCVSSATLSKLNIFYIFVQLAILLSVIVTLAAKTPSEYKNSAHFVFTDFENTGFWPNDGWAFMMSFLTPVWVVSGFESSATIAEEASNAAKAVPFAMISSLVVATITGWAVIITIAFCMGTGIIDIVETPLGQPFAQIAFNSLGKNGAIALLVFLWFSSVCNCSILMVAASRETFAFSRDHGLPFSGFLRQLSANKTPVRAVGFVAVCTLIEGLLMFVNTIAINSIFNLAIMGLYFAYCMPLVSRLCFGHFTPGVFYTGDIISIISAIYSIAWMTFIFILLLFPIYPSPNVQEMNYAVAVLGFVLAFCVVYYYFPKYGGKTFFTGPVRTIDDILDESPEARAAVEQQIAKDREVAMSGTNENIGS